MLLPKDNSLKVAIIHDWINNLGGAERVLFELHAIFPKAPIYTLFYNPDLTIRYLHDAEIRTSALQKIPFINKIYKYLVFLMPLAVEAFDFSEFDLVISSSFGFSKGLILKPGTKHLCYCYSPTRFLWDQSHEYTKSSKSDFKKWISRIFQHFLRIWDRQSALRVDEFVAISEYVKTRIKKYYQREAKVIYPPAPISGQDIETREGDYYLIVSRLFKHKNIHVAVDAFNKLGLPLVIIGQGPEEKKLKKIAGPNIQILGYLSDKKIIKYYANSKAFIMPQDEDFGLTPVEAMSFGKPVLALRKGGALETIIEGQTGEFFDDPIPEALADGVRRLNKNYHIYNISFIKSQAQKFSKENFKKNMLQAIAQLISNDNMI